MARTFKAGDCPDCSTPSFATLSNRIEPLRVPFSSPWCGPGVVSALRMRRKTAPAHE